MSDPMTVEGAVVAVDNDGFLLELSQWSPAVAHALAAKAAIELTDAHWEVLHLLRRFHEEYQLSPATRPLIKYCALHLGPEKGNSAHLNRLFNGTPAKLAAKLAGLPKPTNCI